MIMSTRYCVHCDAEVEDTGGFCLLGHLLRASALTPTVAELRGDPTSTPAAVSDRPETGAQSSALEHEPPVVAVGARAAEEKPEARPAASPSRPPSEDTEEHDALPSESSRYGLWDSLFSSGPSRITAGDPIADFAADGRINWGPRRRFLPGKPFPRQLA
jgi:hypothetical protein